MTREKEVEVMVETIRESLRESLKQLVGEERIPYQRIHAIAQELLKQHRTKNHITIKCDETNNPDPRAGEILVTLSGPRKEMEELLGSMDMVPTYDLDITLGKITGDCMMSVKEVWRPWGLLADGGNEQ
jgi:hypothetical protein